MHGKYPKYKSHPILLKIQQALFICLTLVLFHHSVYAESLNQEIQSKEEKQVDATPKDSEIYFYQILTMGGQGILGNKESTLDAFKITYGGLLDFKRVALDFQLGISKSLHGYERSKVTEVNEFLWYRSDNLIHLYLTRSDVSLLIGGGVGFKYRSEQAVSAYTEGTFLKIRSYAQQELDDYVTSFLAQATFIYKVGREHYSTLRYKRALLLSLTYELMQTPDPLDDLDVLSFNLAFAF